MSSPRRPWPRSRPAAAGDELASYADPRLEVFVAPERDVVVLVALGVPVSLSRSEWDARVVSADDGNELAAGLMQDLSGDRATEIIEAAREAAAQDTDPFVAVRPPALEMPAPGEVDFDLLEDSDREPTECYDPEDNLEEARLSCSVLSWRTDFIPPGTVMPPSHWFEDAMSWRITQWERIEDDGDQADGEWALRAHVPVPASTVAEHEPEPLRSWVGRMTEEGAAWLDELKDAEPQFAGDAQRLRTELGALR